MLIDNFLCKLSHGFSQVTAGVLIKTISGHLPYFIILDYLEPKRVDATKLIRIQTWTTESINKFKSEINNAGMCYMLTTTNHANINTTNHANLNTTNHANLNTTNHANLNTTNHANPNDNLNILNEVISKAKDKHLSVRMITFSKHKHSKSQWITKGIIRSIAYKDKLYIYYKLKHTPANSEQYINRKTIFVTYQRIMKN